MEKMEFKKHYKPGEVLINGEKISERLSELGKEIATDYGNKDLVIVPILKGGFKTGATLVEEVYKAGHKNNEISFTMVKSYEGTESSASPKIIYEMDKKPEGRNILLVDDIIDTGKTLKFLDKKMRDEGAVSVKTFALLSKPDRREVHFEPDYIGFTIPDFWVEGYGMDSSGRGRGNPDIVVGPTL